MNPNQMTGQQLAEFYTTQRATTEALLKLAEAQVGPHGAHAGVVGDKLTRLSTLVDRFDPSDVSLLGGMVCRADAVLDPSYFSNELGSMVDYLKGQATHEALVAERSGIKGQLREVRSGCCINCIIGYIGEDGQRYDRNKSPISASADMGHC